MAQLRRNRGANGTSEPLGRNAEEFLTWPLLVSNEEFPPRGDYIELGDGRASKVRCEERRREPLPASTSPLPALNKKSPPLGGLCMAISLERSLSV